MPSDTISLSVLRVNKRYVSINFPGKEDGRAGVRILVSLVSMLENALRNIPEPVCSKD